MDATSATSLTPELCWTAHPAREHAGRTMLAAAAVAATGWLAWELNRSAGVGVRDSAAWGAAAAAVLVVSLNRFFFRSRFFIDAEGITAEYPLSRARMRWADMVRFDHDDRGGVLGTGARRRVSSRGDMQVLFGGQGGEVIGCIHGHMPKERA